MLDVSVDFVAARMPRPLSDDERSRMEALIDDAVGLIDVAFARAGRDFQAELESVSWLPSAARGVVLEMVSAAVLVGQNAGVRTVSSTTGPQADTITFANVDSVGWGGVRLTDDMLRALGLGRSGARGKFPRPKRWPERRLR